MPDPIKLKPLTGAAPSGPIPARLLDDDEVEHLEAMEKARAKPNKAKKRKKPMHVEGKRK